MGQIHHILVWKCTSVGRLREKMLMRGVRRYPQGVIAGNEKNGDGGKYKFSCFRSTSCGRWMGQIHHILVWKSTSVGRLREKPRWSLRSIQSISFQEYDESGPSIV